MRRRRRRRREGWSTLYWGAGNIASYNTLWGELKECNFTVRVGKIQNKYDEPQTTDYSCMVLGLQHRKM